MKLEGIQDTISKTDLAQKVQQIIQDQQNRQQQMAVTAENAVRTREAEEGVETNVSKEDAEVREEEGRGNPYVSLRKKRARKKRGDDSKSRPQPGGKGGKIDITI